jgi:Zn-dependent protease
MYGLYNLLDKVKTHYRFSGEELKSIALAILLLGFVIGFNDNQESFEILNWLRNLVQSIMLVALAILVRESVRRIYALQFGHKVEFKLWWTGIGIAIALAVISMGKIPFLVYGGMVVSILPRHRLGYFRYNISFKDKAGIALMTNLSSLVLALFFKVMMFLPSPLIEKAMIINIIFAIVNMLPIPPLDGSAIIFMTRTGYFSALALIISASALIYFTNVILAVIGSLAIAAIVAVLFITQVELK